MVIGGPGIRGGQRVDGLCHIMDLCPTVRDLTRDPLERRNLASAPADAAHIGELKERLRLRLKEAGDLIDLDGERWTG